MQGKVEDKSGKEVYGTMCPSDGELRSPYGPDATRLYLVVYRPNKSSPNVVQIFTQRPTMISNA
jgi:hypothetical protein